MFWAFYRMFVIGDVYWLDAYLFLVSNAVINGNGSDDAVTTSEKLDA